jgi:zinc D-Ala-D-Ala carboxypeptidase
MRNMTFSQADTLELKLSQMGKNYRLSRNFQLHEFASKCGADTVLIHPALLVGMQGIRDILGVPLTINSGYRTVAHNDKINGAKHSLHMLGMAVDLSGHDPKEIAKVARDLGMVARTYPTFCHVDIGENRNW